MFRQKARAASSAGFFDVTPPGVPRGSRTELAANVVGDLDRGRADIHHLRARLLVDVNFFAIDEQDSFEPERAGDDADLDHELEQAGGTKRLDVILAIALQQQLCAEIGKRAADDMLTITDSTISSSVAVEKT